jgi:2-C-methyl-D-erythritol 4-phosphate cytidylyltransferase
MRDLLSFCHFYRFDVSLVELIDYPVKLVPGSYQNIKITTPEDLKIAELFLPHA